jgi:hypothetical protein
MVMAPKVAVLARRAAKSTLRLRKGWMQLASAPQETEESQGRQQVDQGQGLGHIPGAHPNGLHIQRQCPCAILNRKKFRDIDLKELAYCYRLYELVDQPVYRELLDTFHALVFDKFADEDEQAGVDKQVVQYLSK